MHAEAAASGLAKRDGGGGLGLEREPKRPIRGDGPGHAPGLDRLERACGQEEVVGGRELLDGLAAAVGEVDLELPAVRMRGVGPVHERG